MARRHNWRAAKVHRPYSYPEAARLLGVHKNTIANWVNRENLPALTECRPYIILGRDLREFLHQRREKKRSRLGSGEMYCLGCKMARKPANSIVEDVSDGAGSANFRATCPVCAKPIHRRVARGRTSEFLRDARSGASRQGRHYADHETPA